MSYELKQDTLDKLGLNKDLTDKTIKVPEEITKEPVGIDEHGNDILRTYSDAEIGINIGNDFLKSKEETTEKPAEKKPEPEKEPLKKEHLEEQAAEEKKSAEVEPTFNDQVIERLKKFEDAESQDQLLKSLDNYDKFNALNIQKSQAIAEERKKLEALVAELGIKDYQEIVDEILKLDDLKDFLESADDWYSEKESNPFRKLVEHWRANNDKILKQHEIKSVFEEERTALELEKEVFEVQKLDGRYTDTDALISLGDLADKHNVDLKTAHKIWLADNRETEVSGLNDRIKSLEKDKTALKKELKTRNEELTELKGKVPAASPGVVEPTGAESFDYSTPSSGFDETEQRLYKKLGVHTA